MSVAAGARRPAARPRGVGGRITGTVVAVVAGLILLAQLVQLPELIDVHEVLSAGFAKALLLFYGLAVAAVAGSALLLPPGRLALPVAGASAVAGLGLLATLTLGGEAWTLAVALATMAACWTAGHWLLLRLGLPALAGTAPAAWLAGATVLGLALLALGRAGALHWATAGIPVLALGAVGLAQIGLRGIRGGAAEAWSALTATRLAAACASVSILLAGLASVWTAAPELMFDALYAKAWLPSEWARTGAIEPLTVHPVLNSIGFAQLLAVPGWLVGAEGVGRYLQWLAAGFVVAAIWWGLRRSAWAPLAALALALTPNLFWQATTAYDDAILTLAAVGLALALVRTIEQPARRVLPEALAVGVLAGACVDFKLHLAPLAAGAALGWIALRAGSRLRAFAGVLAGGVLAAAAPFALRWIDTGNPLFPAWNNVFKSEYWPPVNETFNFPFFDPGPWGPLDVVVRSATDTTVLNEAAPAGAFGLLVGAIVVALILGWRRAAHPALPALWLGLLVGFVTWYAQFRYLRYLLPAGAVAILALGLLTARPSLGRVAQRGALAVLAVAAVAFWPATVAQFWNVPGRDIPWEVAFGDRADREYQRASMPEREALAAFDRLAPPGALALSDAHQRLWLTEGRDVSPDWENQSRLLVSGAVPEGAGDGYRRLRGIGVTWALVSDGGSVTQKPYVGEVLARHGQVEYRDGAWALYRLVDRPAQPAPLDACDEGLTGRPGCWTGTLDRRRGYRGEESPGGISRVLPTCPGRTLVADVRTRGAGAVTVAVDHDTADDTRGRVRGSIPAATGSRIAATAPPGAGTATIALVAPPGAEVTRVRFGHVGRCAR